MQIKILLFTIASLLGVSVQAQWKKFYALENSVDFKRVDVSLKATSGSCIIKPVQNVQMVSVYGSAKETPNANPTFATMLTGSSQSLNIELTNNKASNFSSQFTQQFFAGSASVDDIWKIYLSDAKPMALSLNYAIGDAKVDLSGLSIEKLKINSGSADVKVTYLSDMPNKINMDTFLINVELGSIQVEKLNYTKAKLVDAQVGFGKMLLDFSDKNDVSSRVNASVGAGTLLVYLDDKDETPVVIYINESPLCHVRLSNNFREIKKNVFVNKSYKPDAENLLTFDLDVAMGNIIFKSK